MIDIYVGASKRHWSLHRNILCHHSSYFERECIDADTATRGSTIELLDEDPTAFELLVKWLYQGKIDDVSTLPVEKKWDHADACQKLYILCGRLEMAELKNLAIDQFRKGCNEAGLVPGPEEMIPIYEKTPPSSPFRKLVSKIAARQIMDPESNKDAVTYRDCFESNADFAIDVINAIKDGAGASLFDDPTEGNSCRYHEHENGDTCHKKVKFKKGS
jgi:BTB/POZ domain